MCACRAGRDETATPICITTVLESLYEKWVLGREHCNTGGGQYFHQDRIRQARRQKCKEFPRTPAEQYNVDKEHVWYITHLQAHDPNRERMFTHFVIGTQDSRNARMRAYERTNRIGQFTPDGVTTNKIVTKETYIVHTDRGSGSVYDEIAITTLGDGNTVGMYCTGHADVFTIRDVKHLGKTQVQLVSHLASVRNTERRTWRRVHDFTSGGDMVTKLRYGKLLRLCVRVTHALKRRGRGSRRQ